MFDGDIKNPLFSDKYTILILISSLFILVISIILGYFSRDNQILFLVSIMLTTISSSIFFPLIIGYYYEELKNKKVTERIDNFYKTLTDSGIIRIYKDREWNSINNDNAFTQLSQALLAHNNGEIKMIGVSLRVFYNQMGPYHDNIKKLCGKHKANPEINIKVLICKIDSPEVFNRGKIESPNQVTPLIIDDIEKTMKMIENLNYKYGENAVLLKNYISAPYCTLIIFPDKCFFSPNILSYESPVGLPMIVFNSESHAYIKLTEYFDYIWKNN